jgi:signal peptidase I
MGKLFRVLFWTALVLGVIVGALRLTVIRWWKVPTDDPILETSIAPTLRGGDWVLLWRATAPHFGGLVLCPDPDNAGRFVVGRIFGESNDRVTIDGDRVQVNEHEALTETACNESSFTVNDPDTGAEVKQYCQLEAVGGVLHMRGSNGGLDRAPPVATTRTVGPGNVFLVSDNRAYPYDSRMYGAIERSLCKESIFFRLVSTQGFADVDSRLTYIH